MKLNFSEISKGRPILFYYHAGSGGEFIAKTFAKYHPDYWPLPYNMTDRNQCHSISPIMYSSQWPDRTDPETWINPHFPKPDPFLANDSFDFVLKDHPNDWNLDLYQNQMPDLITIYLYADRQVEHFARLAYAKLGKKVRKTTPAFIRNSVNDLLSEDDEQKIVEWASQYEWVWAHEVMYANTLLADGKGLDNHQHHDSLDKYIADHVEQDRQYQKKFRDDSRQMWVEMCIDDLAVGDSRPWWHLLSGSIFPSLHASERACSEDTNQWILDNFRLLTK